MTEAEGAAVRTHASRRQRGLSVGARVAGEHRPAAAVALHIAIDAQRWLLGTVADRVHLLLTQALGNLIRQGVLTAYPYPAKIWTPEVVAA